MKKKLFTCCALLLCGVSIPAAAESLVGLTRPERADGGDPNPSPYLECVPYARQVSGIQIFGDAHTWWAQAEGRYQRGEKPRTGAVMAFAPHGNMHLGHVAAVSRVIDSRTVLLRHANWSPINGRRGQIENDVRAIDVSENNDWSSVRVWYAPIQALGGTEWPVSGFIYRDTAKGGSGKSGAGKTLLARGDAVRKAGGNGVTAKAKPSGRAYASARWNADKPGLSAMQGRDGKGVTRAAAAGKGKALTHRRAAGSASALAASVKKDPIDMIIARTLK